jgi:hypothetical protein
LFGTLVAFKSAGEATDGRGLVDDREQWFWKILLYRCLYLASPRPAALSAKCAKVACPPDRAPIKKTFRTYLESAGQT